MKKVYSLIIPLLLLLSAMQASAITSGTYKIGPGGDFPDLASAVLDLNGSTINGSVVFEIVSGTYTGSAWQVSIDKVNGASSTNNILIKPVSGGTVNIDVTGTTSDNYVIRLDSAEYVTIQELTLNNTSSSEGRVLDITGTTSHCVVTGCVLTTSSSGSASSSDRAVVYMGTLAGENVIIQNNTINNGYCGVFIDGSSAGSTDDHIISGNTINDPYKYFIYAGYAGNLEITNNTGTGNKTSLKYGFYLSHNQDGGNISGNTLTISTSSGTHYGIYNNAINNNSTDITEYKNNNVLVKCTSSSAHAYSLFNSDSYHLLFDGNIFEANVTTGKAYMPHMASGGTDITATNNTFTAKVTSGRINYNSNYRFISNSSSGNPNNIIVRKNVFNYKATSGTIGYSSTSYFMYYPNNCVVNNNEFNINRTSSGTMYGLGGRYFIYRGENTTMDSNDFNVTYASGGTIYNIVYYYGFYYGEDNSFSNNNITIQSKYATTYGLGNYFAYRCDRFKANNNTLKITNTNKSGTIYTPYYFAYYTNKSEFNNNTFTINSGSGTIRAPYYFRYHTSGTESANNTFNINATSATIYSPYYFNYYCSGSRNHHNTFNINTTSSGTTYCPYYLNAYGSGDTVEYNTFNITRKGGSFYAYNYYLANLSRYNTWNINKTSGSIYFRLYRPQGGVFMNNEINIKNTSGTIYGTYMYGGSSSYRASVINNKFNLESNTGTIYGIYNYYYPGSYKFINNVYSAKTSGSCYMYYNTYGYYGDHLMINNTFHSNATGSTNKFFRQDGGSSSYPGKMYMYNNVFSSTNPVTGDAFDIDDTAYFESDYNLVYAPGTVTRTIGNPSVSTSSLSDWRTGTGQDMNSLMHEPAFVDAANGDLRPDPASPNSWAIQGRGIHIDNDTMDIVGNPRAKTRFDGVPDLGAYEFTPTSTPPDAIAIPANPVANSVQKFVFGGDTVGSMEWGNTVPTSIAVKQYTGVQANITPSATERMYFYVDVQAPLGVYEYKPVIRYKEPWLGNISNETNARIAKSSHGGKWAGYNYQNGITDSINNLLMPADMFDSLDSKFTGVENARIGIRCVVPPFGLIHYNVTAFGATEQWEPVFFPTGYQIIIDTVVSPLDLTKIQFTSTNNPPTYPISNLLENTTYYVNVRTICGAKDTSTWAMDSFRTMITCHDPNINSTSVTHNQAVIYWDTVQTAVGYEYRIDQISGAPSFGTKIGTNYVLASGLKPGTTYYAHVRSFCSTIYDQSGWSEHEFTTQWPSDVRELNGAAGITAFPNPVKDVVAINLVTKPGAGAMLMIANLEGKVVYSSTITQQQTEINMSGMPAGMYTVKYVDNNRTEVIKLTKE